VDLIHETLLRSRGQGNATGTPPQPYWPVLHAYIEANRDRDVLRQQLALQIQRWQRGGKVSRWFRLAGWGQLLDYRRLRPSRKSIVGHFLGLSRRLVAAQAALLLALAAWGTITWWSELVNLGAKVTNTIVYVGILPFWHADIWLPLPEVLELPALTAGRTFDMGCKIGRDDIDGKCPDNEPLKSVPMLQPCAMGKYEVTNLQYNRYLWEENGKGIKPLLDYPSDGIFGTPNRPVVNINWQQAHDYAQWLNTKVPTKAGLVYRLPTEAEWEYAARGNLDARYPWGNETPAGRANYDESRKNKTVAVGSYDANPFGLHDMAGNVSEWVEGKYERGSSSRVLRGGSWGDYARLLRAADRFDYLADFGNSGFGFRVCRGSPIKPQTTGALDAGSPAR
jgi:hypothetical protein